MTRLLQILTRPATVGDSIVWLILFPLIAAPVLILIIEACK